MDKIKIFNFRYGIKNRVSLAWSGSGANRYSNDQRRSRERKMDRAPKLPLGHLLDDHPRKNLLRAKPRHNSP